MTGAAYTTEDGDILLSTFPGSQYVDLLIRDGSLVICERPFQGKFTTSQAHEVKGAIQERCRAKAASFKEQAPSIPSFCRKRFAEPLKRVKGPIHAKEAFMHLLFHLTHSEGWTPEEVIQLIAPGKP